MGKGPGVIYNHHPIMSFCILLHVYTCVCNPERAVQIRTNKNKNCACSDKKGCFSRDF